jgi:hypothetical protein
MIWLANERFPSYLEAAFGELNVKNDKIRKALENKGLVPPEFCDSEFETTAARESQWFPEWTQDQKMDHERGVGEVSKAYGFNFYSKTRPVFAPHSHEGDGGFKLLEHVKGPNRTEEMSEPLKESTLDAFIFTCPPEYKRKKYIRGQLALERLKEYFFEEVDGESYEVLQASFVGQIRGKGADLKGGLSKKALKCIDIEKQIALAAKELAEEVGHEDLKREEVIKYLSQKQYNEAEKELQVPGRKLKKKQILFHMQKKIKTGGEDRLGQFLDKREWEEALLRYFQGNASGKGNILGQFLEGRELKDALWSMHIEKKIEEAKTELVAAEAEDLEKADIYLNLLISGYGEAAEKDLDARFAEVAFTLGRGDSSEFCVLNADIQNRVDEIKHALRNLAINKLAGHAQRVLTKRALPLEGSSGDDLSGETVATDTVHLSKAVIVCTLSLLEANPVIAASKVLGVRTKLRERYAELLNKEFAEEIDDEMKVEVEVEGEGGGAAALGEVSSSGSSSLSGLLHDANVGVQMVYHEDMLGENKKIATDWYNNIYNSSSVFDPKYSRIKALFESNRSWFEEKFKKAFTPGELAEFKRMVVAEQGNPLDERIESYQREELFVMHLLTKLTHGRIIQVIHDFQSLPGAIAEGSSPKEEYKEAAMLAFRMSLTNQSGKPVSKLFLEQINEAYLRAYEDGKRSRANSSLSSVVQVREERVRGFYPIEQTSDLQKRRELIQQIYRLYRAQCILFDLKEEKDFGTLHKHILKDADKMGTKEYAKVVQYCQWISIEMGMLLESDPALICSLEEHEHRLEVDIRDAEREYSEVCKRYEIEAVFRNFPRRRFLAEVEEALAASSVASLQQKEEDPTSAVKALGSSVADKVKMERGLDLAEKIKRLHDKLCAGGSEQFRKKARKVKKENKGAAKKEANRAARYQDSIAYEKELQLEQIVGGAAAAEGAGAGILDGLSRADLVFDLKQEVAAAKKSLKEDGRSEGVDEAPTLQIKSESENQVGEGAKACNAKSPTLEFLKKQLIRVLHAHDPRGESGLQADLEAVFVKHLNRKVDGGADAVPANMNSGRKLRRTNSARGLLGESARVSPLGVRPGSVGAAVQARSLRPSDDAASFQSVAADRAAAVQANPPSLADALGDYIQNGTEVHECSSAVTVTGSVDDRELAAIAEKRERAAFAATSSESFAERLLPVFPAVPASQRRLALAKSNSLGDFEEQLKHEERGDGTDSDSRSNAS